MNSRYYKQQRIHYALIQSTTKPKKPISPGDVGQCWGGIEEWKCESSFYWRFEWYPLYDEI